MKKAYNISIGKRIFYIEEDAANKLQNYIRILENYYLKEEGGREIMNDIENRIAELFQESIADANEAITLIEVDKVIATIGTPDDLINDEYASEPPKKIVRKLYRNIDDNILGGVASGIATYFNVSSVWIRLLFLIFLFFYGAAVWIYIILWIIIPAARTPKQKMEMKGEEVTLSNIEKKIRNGIDEINNDKVQGFFDKLGNGINQIFVAIGNILGETGKVLLKIIAVFIFIICILTAVGLLTGLVAALFTKGAINGIELGFFMPQGLAILAYICVTLVVIIPLALLIWVTASYIFNITRKKTPYILTLFLIWIGSVIILSGIGISQAMSFKDYTIDEKIYPLELSENNIIIKTNENYKVQTKHYRWGHKLMIVEDGDGKRKSKRNKRLLQEANYKVRLSSQNVPEIIFRGKAYGFTEEDASASIENIEYNRDFKDNTLYLDKYFSLTPKSKWRNQDLEVIIMLPEGYTIEFDRNTTHLLRRSYKANTPYIMTKNGLITLEEYNNKLNTPVEE